MAQATLQDSAIILALDTATIGCSVGLYRKNSVLCERIIPEASGQAEILVPMIEEMVQKAAIDMSAIDAIAVTLGPGSFTGVRIGFMTAQTLAFTLKKPLYGMTTFDTFVHGVKMHKMQKCICVESKRADLFLQFYDAHNNAVGDPFSALPDAVPFEKNVPYMLAGDAAHKVYDALKDCYDLHLSEVKTLAPSSLAALCFERPVPQEQPKPFYLRNADVTVRPQS